MSSYRLRAEIRKAVALATLLGISALFFSCDRVFPPKEPAAIPAPAPAANELYVFSLGRLSMDAYEVLRREYPGVSPRDLARISMTAQWLRTKLLPGSRTTLLETTRCVRALFDPPVSEKDRSAAAEIAKSRFGFASLDLLRESAADAARGWAVEWNPSLAKEYGISTAKAEK